MPTRCGQHLETASGRPEQRIHGVRLRWRQAYRVNPVRLQSRRETRLFAGLRRRSTIPMVAIGTESLAVQELDGPSVRRSELCAGILRPTVVELEGGRVRSIPRKLRGLLGMGVVWALAWVPLTVGIGVIERLVAGSGLPTLAELFTYAATGLQSGFIAGVLFGAGLSLVYGNRLLRKLRPGSMGVLGGVGGVLLAVATLGPAVVAGMLPPIPAILVTTYCGIFGAASAVGSVKLAQANKGQLKSGTELDSARLINA